jgi:hypothetical protein
MTRDTAALLKIDPQKATEAWFCRKSRRINPASAGKNGTASVKLAVFIFQTKSGLCQVSQRVLTASQMPRQKIHPKGGGFCI